MFFSLRAKAVEREFARLKNEHGLASFRVRGADRVALQTDFTMLARLTQAPHSTTRSTSTPGAHSLNRSGPSPKERALHPPSLFPNV